MKKSIALKTAIVLATTAIASNAVAKPGEGGKGHDKKRTPAAVFDALDANGDGNLSLDELAASKRFEGAEQAEVEAAFAKRDENGDGAISKQEFAAGAKARRGGKKGKGKGEGAGRRRGGEGKGEGAGKRRGKGGKRPGEDAPGE